MRRHDDAHKAGGKAAKQDQARMLRHLDAMGKRPQGSASRQ